MKRNEGWGGSARRRGSDKTVVISDSSWRETDFREMCGEGRSTAAVETVGALSLVEGGKPVRRRVPLRLLLRPLLRRSSSAEISKMPCSKGSIVSGVNEQEAKPVKKRVRRSKQSAWEIVSELQERRRGKEQSRKMREKHATHNLDAH